MKSKNPRRGIVPLLLGLCLIPSAHADWTLVDDSRGPSAWTGSGGLAMDPADATNQVFAMPRPGTATVSAYRSIPPIANNATATLFCRIRVSGTAGISDWAFGLSDVAAPVPFGDYEVQARFTNDAALGTGIGFDVRNGGSFARVTTVNQDAWYNVWMVVDNSSDRTTFYVSTGAGGATAPGAFTFANATFRNGVAANALVSLLVANNRQNVTGHIDDIYIDLTGENLSNPTFVDSDGDGLPDVWEVANDLDPDDDGSTDPVNGATGDPDEDTLSNLSEYEAGTNPRRADTDGDGLSDGAEIAGSANAFDATPTDPLKADTDADGVSDGDENGVRNTVFGLAATNPHAADTDGDGLPDGYELSCQTPGTALNPNDDGSTDPTQAPLADRDLDTLANVDEYLGASPRPQTRADLADTDGDGYSDSAEDNVGSWGGIGFTGTNPVLADTDGDGIPDGQENPDLAGFPGANVYPTNSDPTLADTDNDQFSDGFEVRQGTNPVDASSKPTQPTGFTLVEDFEGEGMEVGSTFHGVNGWTSRQPALSVVADEPLAGGGDQVGLLTRDPALVASSVFKSLDEGGLQVLDGNTGTLFLQLFCESNQVNLSYGLSDQIAPALNDFASFEAQNTVFRNDIIRIRDAGVFRDVGSYPTGRWVNVWIVADNAADIVRVLWESPQGQTGQVELTAGSEADPFNFRNGTLDALKSVLLMFAGDADAAARTFVDNIHVDPAAVNLATPAADKPEPPPSDVRITGVVRLPGGDLRITFSPGGAGFILTSSNDLAAPFAVEPAATYDGVDTFTVPAAALNPGRDFFRVESE